MNSSVHTQQGHSQADFRNALSSLSTDVPDCPRSSSDSWFHPEKPSAN